MSARIFERGANANACEYASTSGDEFVIDQFGGTVIHGGDGCGLWNARDCIAGACLMRVAICGDDDTKRAGFFDAEGVCFE